MADAVSAILGNPPQPVNPLQIISGWQDYANKVQEGKNMQQQLLNLQLQNQTGQQALGQTMAQRHSQIMAGLSVLPDDQLPGAAGKALDDELATGQIDQQRYDVLKNRVTANASNPSALRADILTGLIGNLAGPQALAALSPQVVNQDIGGQIVPRVMPSPVQALQGQTNVGFAGGAINRSLPPGYQETGGQIVPVGGAAGQPTLNRTLTPGESTQLQPRMVQNPDGSFSVVTQQIGQWNPGMAPQAGKLGGGNYPGPSATAVPLGTQEKLASDQQAYQTDQNRVGALQTGTQSLGKALSALNMVATGAGTEGLARMRSYAVSLGNIAGLDTGGVNVQDMNRAELEKYLTDYARQSGTAGRSDEALTAAFKSNASGSINNAAAQDVVRTNIGRDRQSIAATMTAPNQQGSGYASHKSNLMLNTDPRGFAWDTYTPQQKAQIVKETQGSQGKNSPEYQKLARAVGMAQQLKMLNFSAPQPQNVNAAP